MGKNKKKLYFYLAIIIIIFIVPFSFDVKANQNQQSSISIFINSYPYKADIYLNKKYVGQSPIIVRDIVSSKIEVKIIKKDYFPFSTDLKIEKDEKYKSLYIVLSNKKISLSSLDSKVNIKNNTYDSPVSIENMPSGFYRIYKKNDTIYIVPDNFKFFISLLSYFLTGFSTYLTISNPSNVNLIVMTVASAVLSIYFLFTTAFPKKVDLTVNTNPQNKPDETLFLKGQSLINQGEYDLAIDQFLAIIDNFPESYYIPHAIYYIAFCYDATSQYEKSKNYYEKLLQEYPIIDFYDISYYSLGKIYYDSKLYEKSINYFQNIIFIDENIISRATVYAYLLLNYIKLNLSGQGSYTNEIDFYFEQVSGMRIGILRGEVYYNMALYYLSQNKIEDAKALLQRIISDELTYMDEAIALLKTIK